MSTHKDNPKIIEWEVKVRSQDIVEQIDAKITHWAQFNDEHKSDMIAIAKERERVINLKRLKYKKRTKIKPRSVDLCMCEYTQYAYVQLFD